MEFSSLTRVGTTTLQCEFAGDIYSRRRLINSPLTKRIRIKGTTHPKVKRWGAAALNFALGPAEMLAALKECRPCRLSARLALHLNEVTLAILKREWRTSHADSLPSY